MPRTCSAPDTLRQHHICRQATPYPARRTASPSRLEATKQPTKIIAGRHRKPFDINTQNTESGVVAKRAYSIYRKRWRIESPQTAGRTSAAAVRSAGSSCGEHVSTGAWWQPASRCCHASTRHATFAVERRDIADGTSRIYVMPNRVAASAKRQREQASKPHKRDIRLALSVCQPVVEGSGYR